MITGDDHLGPGAQALEELVQILTQGLQHEPFELVGADLDFLLDLLPERPAGGGELSLIPWSHQALLQWARDGRSSSGRPRRQGVQCPDTTPTGFTC